jgi:peptidyl-prolyl cis-trans isomerase SurA
MEVLKYFSKFLGIIVLLYFVSPAAKAQVVDEVVGVVGDKIILKSEIDIEVERIKKNSEGVVPPNIFCEVLNQKLAEKLMLHKADLDSVVADEDRVTAELDYRIKKLVAQFGSEKAFENYYGKTIAEIKASNRDKVRDDMLVSEMQQKILKEVKVSPTDIKKYFNNIPDDSLPFYSSEVEIAQIIKLPEVSKEAKLNAYERIKEIRERILNGESFQTLAILYSDDHGSAKRGGELGFFSRGDMVPEFEAMSFKLRGDTVSKIIETKYGYHILQLIERKGESINVRHILIRAQTSKADLALAKQLMDSVYYRITKDTLLFEDAAKKYSDDEDSKSGGGYLRDPATGSTKVLVEELDKNLYLAIERLHPGQITEPELITLPDGSQAYRMIYLKSETKPHKANLRDDYQKYQAMAFQKKQEEVMSKWIDKYRQKYYVRIADGYITCASIEQWLKSQ